MAGGPGRRANTGRDAGDRRPVRNTRRRRVPRFAVDRGAYPERSGGSVPVQELARRQGVRPIRSAKDLVRDDIFESDEELAEFLADLDAFRHSDLASS
jgi:hypothetical protein